MFLKILKGYGVNDCVSRLYIAVHIEITESMGIDCFMIAFPGLPIAIVFHLSDTVTAVLI
jgi:hypothetical protein